MKQKLFVYGSLMSESVFKTVIQLPVDYLINKHPARLYGYLRFQVEGQAYPGIVKADQQTFVDGELIELPSDPSDCQRWLERLDLFEGIDEVKCLIVTN
jgi:gamma-glutamylcyclotransferase (GGCT)/AIG2-like uncharacterized protein YtfP